MEHKNLEEGGICEWINAYLRDEIDAEVFANLVIFNYFRAGDISITLKGTILLAMGGMLSKKPFSPQDRKKVKELLRKMAEAYNQSDKTDKTDDVQPMVDDILKIVYSASK
jgi:hypothetical protein